jgi:hypothetical protein
LQIITAPIYSDDAASVTAFEISGAILLKINIGINGGF